MLKGITYEEKTKKRIVRKDDKIIGKIIRPKNNTLITQPESSRYQLIFPKK